MKTTTLATLSALALSGMTALASPLATTTYGGHTYELWEAGGISWQNAKSAAVADGGYLATFTTAAETASVYGAFIGTGFFQVGNSLQIEAWLGGYTKDLSYSTTNPNNWAWVTGEAWTAFDAGNFGGGEPNGDSSGLTINRFGTSQWNDEGGYVGGYIVEKGATGVPDTGSTLVLLGGALSLVGLVRRGARR